MYVSAIQTPLTSEADSPLYPSVSLLEPKSAYFYNRGMIWPCSDTNLAEIHDIINEAAKVYRSVIPADRYKEPYMSGDELIDEIDNGVKFWACSIEDDIAGILHSRSGAVLATPPEHH